MMLDFNLAEPQYEKGRRRHRWTDINRERGQFGQLAVMACLRCGIRRYNWADSTYYFECGGMGRKWGHAPNCPPNETDRVMT
jgi:hypothetical protein